MTEVCTTTTEAASPEEGMLWLHDETACHARGLNDGGTVLTYGEEGRVALALVSAKDGHVIMSLDEAAAVVRNLTIAIQGATA